jgi:hypothetical protein
MRAKLGLNVHEGTRTEWLLHTNFKMVSDPEPHFKAEEVAIHGPKQSNHQGTSSYII